MKLLSDYEALQRMNRLPHEVNKAILENINPAMELRPYQLQALNRFQDYMGSSFRTQPTHLLFQMATGSGKTLIMASSILHLYTLGYRNFIFFVNSTNIIQKTKENFLKSHSSKYLFNSSINIDGELIRVKEVENFQGANDEDINIHFTTIQGLHSRMNAPRENALTYEEFKDMEVVFLSDEAHHMNVDTRRAQNKSLNKGEQELSLSWEGTVQRILHSNDANVMLEFTATADLSEPEIIEKYQDKLIYDYSLKQFYVDKYSKDVHVLQSDMDLLDRALQAVILSQYRQKVFADNGLLIKPVVMFKANAVNPPKKPDPEKIVSKEFRADFEAMISKLTVKQIEKIRNNPNAKNSVLAEAFKYFKENGLSLDNLVLQLKEGFSEDKCVSIDSSTENEQNQILINSLEDADNRIRAVFAVEALNEGWDVLNLFDIVRLYNKRDAKAGKPGKTTISEAQLIGRGARYCPFKLEDTQPIDQRKYDDDLNHQMRVCEELYYHSEQNSRYIAELHTALDMIGIKPKTVTRRSLILKEGFKKTDFYKNDYIFLNKQIKNTNTEVKELPKYLREKEYKYSISSGTVKETAIIKASPQNTNVEQITSIVKLNEIDNSIIRKALRCIPSMKFSRLRKHFPNLEGVEQFINDDNYLNSVQITLTGSEEALSEVSRHDLLRAVLSVLFNISEEIIKGSVDKKGSIEFKPQAIAQIFKDKELNFNLADEGSDAEIGISMMQPKDSSLYSNLEEKPWYAFNDCFGTSEEKKLIKFVESSITNLQKKYDKVYLLRNEKHFQIYNFEDGRAFEPDFVLFLENKEGNNSKYQVFIEPKGGHLSDSDKWKEDFLLLLKDKAKLEKISASKDFIMYGLPFFTSDNNKSFHEAYSKL